MRKLRKLLIGLAGLSLSVGAAIGVGLNNSQKPVEEAKAAATNGKYRINVLTSSSAWLNEGKTLTNPGATNVEFERDTDFTISPSNSNYSLVTIGSTTYSWATYVADNTNPFYTGDMWFGRGSISSDKDWFDGGINLKDKMQDHKYDNTFIISDDGNGHFSAACYGWWVKVTLHTGNNGSTISNILMNSASVPDDPDDLPDGYHVKWYTDQECTQRWVSGSQYTDINLYAQYEEDKADGFYLRGDWGENKYGWSWAGQLAMSSDGTGGATISNIALGVNGKVKVIYIEDNEVTHWYTPSYYGPTEADPGYSISLDGDGNAKVSAAGTYTIHIYWAYGDCNLNFTRTSNPALEAAISFAEDFVEAMYAECPYNYKEEDYNDGKSSSTIADEWLSQLQAYALLDESIKTYLSTNAGSTVHQITVMWSSYDYVYGHYQTVRDVNNKNANFLGRNPTIIASYSSTPAITSGQANNTSLIIVVVASTVALLAVGGYFFIRKRKEF